MGRAWLELCDEPGNPHRGASLGVSFSRFDDRDGNAFRSNRTVVDLREYVRLGSNRHLGRGTLLAPRGRERRERERYL
jgi:hypothetical protein